MAPHVAQAVQGGRTGNAGAVQALFGMEIELAIPVTLEKKNIPYNTKLFTGDGYKVVTDHAKRAGTIKKKIKHKGIVDSSAPCLELVTSPIDEYSSQADLKLKQVIKNMRLFVAGIRSATGSYTNPATLESVKTKAVEAGHDNSLQIVTTDYKDAKVCNAENMSAEPELGAVHFTLGVDPGKVDRLMEWASDRKNVLGGKQTRYAGESRTAAKGIIDNLKKSKAHDELGKPDLQKLTGLLELIYVHVKGFVELDVLTKNTTNLLSRAPLQQVYDIMSESERKLVEKTRTFIADALLKAMGFQKNQSMDKTFKVTEYIDSALGTGKAIPQSALYGAMHETTFESVGPSNDLGIRTSGTAVELRRNIAGHKPCYLAPNQWEEEAMKMFNLSREIHGLPTLAKEKTYEDKSKEILALFKN